jgi:hypothetical protein
MAVLPTTVESSHPGPRTIDDHDMMMAVAPGVALGDQLRAFLEEAALSGEETAGPSAQEVDATVTDGRGDDAGSEKHLRKDESLVVLFDRLVGSLGMMILRICGRWRWE